MENQEQYEEAVKMLQAGFGEDCKVTPPGSWMKLTNHLDRIRSLRSRQTDKKRSRSSDEATNDTNSASKSSVATEPIKPAKPVKKDNLTIIKTYPLVDLVFESDAEDEGASSDMQPPPNKKTKLAQSSKGTTATTPVGRFYGTQEDIDTMREKLTTMTDNKMRPASVRLHLPDASTIHELEAIIDTLVRPYLAMSQSEKRTEYQQYLEDRDKFNEAVENLLKAWVYYFGLQGPPTLHISSAPLKTYFSSLYLVRHDDQWQREDWYGTWAAKQRDLLWFVQPNDVSMSKDPHGQKKE